MMRIAGIVILWAVVLVIGMVGLFNQQTGFMAVCLFSWTPIAVIFGYSWKAAGLRVVASINPEPVSRHIERPVQQPSRIQKRESRL